MTSTPRLRIRASAALAAAAGLLLAGCGEAPEKSAEPAVGGSDYKACVVSGLGGWDDKSFNQSAAAGLDRAVDELGVDSARADSQAESDFAPNIDAMVSQGCDLVLGASFLLEDDLQKAAEDSPDTDFGLIDAEFADADGNPVAVANGKPIVFDTAEASYLAGYLAAGMSESGTVATFGGMEIPPVTVFMDGFADGVAKYNEDHPEASVEVLGWDKGAQRGSFSGDFENQGQGKALTEQFISQGADVIMPVAGNVGLGALAAAKEADGTRVVWVDTDGCETTEYCDVILTSVLKDISNAVVDTVAEAADGGFSADPYVGTLENEGVGLAPFHEADGDVPDDLRAAVEDLRAQIASGEIVVDSPNAP